MSDGYEVDPSALTHDADACWTPWSADLGAIRDAAPVEIEVLHFSVLPWFAPIGEEFVKAAAAMKASLDDGCTEFAGVASTLGAVRDRYALAESDVQAEVAAVAAALDEI